MSSVQRRAAEIPARIVGCQATDGRVQVQEALVLQHGVSSVQRQASERVGDSHMGVIEVTATRVVSGCQACRDELLRLSILQMIVIVVLVTRIV